MPAATCSRSVDLPMPGSPPTRPTDPVVSPPPRTRSSSAMPVDSRIAPLSGEPSSTAAPGRLARAPGARDWTAATCAPATRVSVFHSLQWGHWPCHFADSPPQLPQTNTVAGRAMACSAAAGAAPGRPPGRAAIGQRAGGAAERRRRAGITVRCPPSGAAPARRRSHM